MALCSEANSNIFSWADKKRNISQIDHLLIYGNGSDSKVLNQIEAKEDNNSNAFICIDLHIPQKIRLIQILWLLAFMCVIIAATQSN